MKIKSAYLKKEYEVSQYQFNDDRGEAVTIIPHSTLEDIIMNDPDCAALNIQVHYTPLVSEPGHYAFLCAISDKTGRRVETVGESLSETLTTKIARDYPVLMAAKRAFDDAAIKYLRFGKAYSDQQINPQDVSASDRTAPTGTATTEKTKAASAEKPTRTTKPVKKETPVDTAPASSNTTEAPESKVENEPNTAEAEPKAENESNADSAPESDISPDVFDTTIVTVGSCKRLGLSFRECYKKNPGSIRWIANDMPANTDKAKEQQRIAKAFLKTVEEAA